MCDRKERSESATGPVVSVWPILSTLWPVGLGMLFPQREVQGEATVMAAAELPAWDMRDERPSTWCSMAAPTSLSADFCDLQHSKAVTLCQDRRKTVAINNMCGHDRSEVAPFRPGERGADQADLPPQDSNAGFSITSATASFLSARLHQPGNGTDTHRWERIGPHRRYRPTRPDRSRPIGLRSPGSAPSDPAR
jgi:hypothetical protein